MSPNLGILFNLIEDPLSPYKWCLSLQLTQHIIMAISKNGCEVEPTKPTPVTALLQPPPGTHSMKAQGYDIVQNPRRLSSNQKQQFPIPFNRIYGNQPTFKQTLFKLTEILYHIFL